MFWVGSYFYVLFFLYIKSSFVLLFVVFLMKKGNKKLFKIALLSWTSVGPLKRPIDEMIA